MQNDKCIIWGAGYVGGIALKAYGEDHVLFFGDSDERNVGDIRWGKKIISYCEMIRYAKEDKMRIVAASEDYLSEMECRLKEEGISNYDLFISECAKDVVSDRYRGISPMIKKYNAFSIPVEHDELKCFKNCHSDRRIFLIGNGPSLRAEDLDKLHKEKEICFGFNNIHSIFKYTDWRPDYYGVADFYGYLINKEIIESVPGTHFLWDLFRPLFPEYSNGRDNYYFHYYRNSYSVDSMPDFSDDIVKGLYLGYSSVYDIGLQVAAYMGASEIVLLGTDHNYPNKYDHKGNHFEGYLTDQMSQKNEMIFYPKEKLNKAYEYEKVNRAFERARLYAENKGIKVLNATRGGKLDVFQRVDFDSLY